MLDESKDGQPSPKSAKRKRKRSNGRQKLKNAALKAKGSHPQSDASSTDNSLSKPERESLSTGLQKESEGIVEVDASTNRVTFKLERIFGTNNDDLTHALAQQVGAFVPTVAGKFDSPNLKWALTTLCEIGPKDELERLLAVQMIGVHRLAVDCLSLASREGQTIEGMDANINRATKLLRTFTAQMEALSRHLVKVGQLMVVGNVIVNEGGQAIVGPVSHDGRGKAPTEHAADGVE